MLRRSYSFLIKLEPNPTLQRLFSSSNHLREKWDLLAAVCLERKPVITPPLTDLEQAYKNVLLDVEFEKSLKSDHEMRHEKEMKQMEQLKSGEDHDVHLKQTAQDIVDASTEELSKFQFGSRITEADKTNNLKSLNRKLDKHLVLVTKQKLGDDSFFLLPQTVRKEGETLRQTTDRLLSDTVGKDLKAAVYGNAPFGFYKYKYPKALREQNGAVGAKVFIYFARYIQGELPSKGLDYQWVDNDELAKILPNGYKESVLQMLIDE